jgi:tetratricopeptide (TPR) repeat protein
MTQLTTERWLGRGRTLPRTVISAMFVMPLCLASVASAEDSSGVSSGWSLQNCKSDADSAVREFANDRAVIFRVDKLIECKNPIGYEIRGSARFYEANYSEAVQDFELAVDHLPDSEGPTKLLWESDLGDAYIETGRYSDALSTFTRVVEQARQAHVASDEFRLGLARAYLYQGQNDARSYSHAIELLRGVSPNFRGPSAPGIVQIVLSAAEVGQSTRADVDSTARSTAAQQAKETLCIGISKSESYWRSVLNSTTPFQMASFREEIRLLSEIGGGNVVCSG